MAQIVKNLPFIYAGDPDSWVGTIPWGQGMATHSNILTWRIPWTEEPGGLQSIGSEGAGHDLACKQKLSLQNNKNTA